MLSIDLAGKRAFVAGVGDDNGFGWAIAKALHQAGASVCLGVFPLVWTLFTRNLERGKYNESRKYDGGQLDFERVYPLDVSFDTLVDVPESIQMNERYKDLPFYTMEQCAGKLRDDFACAGAGCLDIIIHSVANGPEVKNPLLETSRAGYLGAISASTYSFVSMIQWFGPLLRPLGSALCMSYLAGERVIPGYGGGMSSAKAALESDTRVLAFEAGRKWGARVNAISAGPLASRAAKAIGSIHSMKECWIK